jgi:hypothetical protein
VKYQKEEESKVAEAQVLYEQIDYLLEHSLSACPADCKDCRMLAELRRYVSERFGSVKPEKGGGQ